MKKTGITVLFILLSFGLCLAATPGAAGDQSSPGEKVDQLRKAISETPDTSRKAAFYRELGEFYASKDDYKKAAEEYLEALSLFSGFSENERYKMALHISWAGRLDDAVTVLRKLLADYPDNVEARIHLARILRWEGKVAEAHDEIEKVLKAHPDNKDALQVKASILNSLGRTKDSLVLSEKLLEAKDDFDVRLGLAYALISARKIERALGNADLLKPAYPYQERELAKFREELNKFVRPRYTVEYSYYEDSDDNAVQRYRLSMGKFIGDVDFNMSYLFTAARDRIRHNSAHDIMAEASYGLAESYGLGLGLGANRTDAITHETSFSGYARIDRKIPGGSIGLTVNRYALSDTAQLIENNITAVRMGAYASKTLVGKLSIYAAYYYSDYSDNNNSNDFMIVPSYALRTGNPAITLKYTFRYVGFSRQTGSGYYDPTSILSNQLSAYLLYEDGKFIMSLSPYGGYQATRRSGRDDDGFFGGGSASLGYRITDSMAVELFAEGGNSALSTKGGWNYYMTGIRLKGHF